MLRFQKTFQRLVNSLLEPLKLNKGRKSTICDRHHYNSDVNGWMGLLVSPGTKYLRHCNGIGGHSRKRATLKESWCTYSSFLFRLTIGKWVRNCTSWQQVKERMSEKHGYSPRTLERNFYGLYNELPKSRGNEVIWVTVDRFSRYNHLTFRSYQITAKGLVNLEQY